MFTETLFIIVKSWEQLNVYKWEDKYHCGISLKQNPIQELKKKKKSTLLSHSATWMNLKKHYVEQKVPDTRQPMVYNFIHLNLNKQNKSMLVYMRKWLPPGVWGGN